MAKEIERKFLLKDDSWKKEVTFSSFFCQAYIPIRSGEKFCTQRVRIAGEKAFLTLKSNRGTDGESFTRNEFEYSIPLEDARVILKDFCGNTVEKTRHIVPAGNMLRWEIDEFSGENAGLVVAEIELPASQSSFPIPAWLGEEVTHDHKYSNSFLAEHPYRKWEKDEKN
ncbi:MAG: CYTH domain-containing protein [Lentisphaeria bacterium]|nr:CYTH domain-containing protein [Lentisphaeria bacterium]